MRKKAMGIMERNTHTGHGRIMSISPSLYVSTVKFTEAMQISIDINTVTISVNISSINLLVPFRIMGNISTRIWAFSFAAILGPSKKVFCGFFHIFDLIVNILGPFCEKKVPR